MVASDGKGIKEPKVHFDEAAKLGGPSDCRFPNRDARGCCNVPVASKRAMLVVAAVVVVWLARIRHCFRHPAAFPMVVREGVAGVMPAAAAFVAVATTRPIEPAKRRKMDFPKRKQIYLQAKDFQS